MRLIRSFLLCAGVSYGFYFPGVSPVTYHIGDEIPLLVNYLSSDFLWNIDYYSDSIGLCKPNTIKEQSESLGSVIFGDRLYNSPFKVSMLKNSECVKLCDTTIDTALWNTFFGYRYSYNWLVDGLPVLGIDGTSDANGYHNNSELFMGYQADEQKYIYNHFDIYIHYNDRGKGEYRVVFAEAKPISLPRTGSELCSKDAKPVPIGSGNHENITFTYSVIFKKSDISWSTRWDQYLHVYDFDIQLAELISFSLVVLLLSSVLVHSLFRVLKRDIAAYSEFNLDDEFQQDYCWKIIHGEVFRSPSKALLLSVFVGSGSQLFFMALCTVLLGSCGFLSPSARGSLGTVMFVLYALFGGVGSYTSMSIYKFFGGQNWKLNLILTPLLIPVFLFVTTVLLNFFLIYAKSSGAMPFGTMVTIIILWFILSVPVSIIGSLLSWKLNRWDEHPAKTNQIARQVPSQPWYIKTWVATFLAGMFPFGAMAVELYYIYASIWGEIIFFMYGFLFVAFILLTLTTSLVTILLTYYSLCMENWKWQWRSFIIGGVGCSVYVFLHSLFFIKFKFPGFVSMVLYLGYSAMVSIVCCLVTGSIGFLANLWFVRKIYSNIKVD
ncbi:transmembrane 9 family protein Ecym_4317 [Eremothecium cymbalariae DBVPG|uniref:Transmembrane 9 superfamily member n=1 Tax=Eremothecium cymbalariae (strain CBS 270.75 / DBVPG 7215 / KCTC 17166 / NRRL Y-17582) TaxID=931890 RepID=G8JTM7_ERECY|nr:hypothetical protein Ecym_4317 [Eremothecium cymbalariae DBVPG\